MNLLVALAMLVLGAFLAIAAAKDWIKTENDYFNR
jgi:hypothetical protein